MTDKEKRDWLAVKYPVTIIRDRYEGTYSGALWLVFPVDYNEIPEGVDGDDVECAEFWESYNEPVGKGTYPNDALADLLEKMNESEDERVRKEIVSIVQSYRDSCISEGSHRFDDVLAWLEKQKEQKPVNDSASTMIPSCWEYEQKPVEWSEEDEKMLKNVLFVLEYYVSQSKSASSPSLITTYPTYYKEIDWLKSLRPPQYCENCRLKKSVQGWKPSEEQMEAFEDVLEAINTKTNLGRLHLYQQGALGRLYQDLKKL